MNPVPVYQQFLWNLYHHGGTANSALTILFIEMCREAEFEIKPRCRTLTLGRNGHLIIMKHRSDRDGMVVAFRLRGTTRWIARQRVAELNALARRSGKDPRAVRAALQRIVTALTRATARVA